jgi:2,3-bisphosphoglycerate-independent phosphoglycerate mutase
MLVILDGWGWRAETADNAVRLSNTPTFNKLWTQFPHALLHTSGLDVGLPTGQMGNSEVGHLNIGAGRVVMQDLPRIATAIADHSIEQAPAFLALVAALRASGGTCHLMGLMSPGGVHSHQDHAIALARLLTARKIPVTLHLFTDGRDTAPRAGSRFLADFVKQLPDSARIGTISGRYYAMDRDKRWERVSKAYNVIADAQGPGFPDAASVIDAAYQQDITDEFVPPAVVGNYKGMRDGDAVLCFNFRADRVREILAPFADEDFTGFERKRFVKLCSLTGMTHYSDALAPKMGVIFPPQTMEHLLGQIVADAGLTQLRMAETEKFPHVTYFFNGGREALYPREDRIMVPSPKVATYDMQPEMSAPELADKAVAAIDGGKYDMIVLNFANPDMVGHTGVLSAAIRAVETVDGCLGQILDAVMRAGGALLITADHGNCELMKDPVTGGPHTSHTTNPVPVMLAGGPAGITLHDGRLADIAPTMLALMELPIPSEMTGKPLFDPHAAAAA